MTVRILSAGSNAHGQLAQNTESDSHIFRECIFAGPNNPLLHNGTHVIDIATGANHTLVLLRQLDGRTQLWGCGDGSKGQLGESNRRESSSSTLRPIDFELDSNGNITLIAAAWETSFVVISGTHGGDGDVLLSMGANDFGDLGVSRSSPESIKGSTTYNIVTLSHLFSCESVVRNLRVLGIWAGTHHVLARISGKLPDDQERELVTGWGASRHGQLGPHQSGVSIPYVPSPCIVPISDVLSIALGNQHTVFLQSHGRAHGFGSNRKNQLGGLNAALTNVRALGATWNGTYLVLQDSDQWSISAFGSNSKGQLACDPSEASFQPLAKICFPATTAACEFMDIACGSEHVLVALSRPSTSLEHRSTEVWGWGWNEHGNLGLGHTEDVTSPTRIWPPINCATKGTANVVGTWAGCGTSWVALEDV